MDQESNRVVLRRQAFKFALRPNGEQLRNLRQFAGSCRLVYNKALVLNVARYEKKEKRLGYASLCALLPKLENATFASLQGDFVRSKVPEHIRVQLPDSVVVMDEKNNILVRSAAVIYVMKRLGGMWFLAASLLSLVPRALRDLGYVTCAFLRKAILGTTQEVCPLVPTQWRARFRN